MAIFRDILKEQKAYLPKISISGQIVSDIVAQLCLENSIQTLLNFFGSTHFYDVIALVIYRQAQLELNDG